jgi:cytochrome c
MIGGLMGMKRAVRAGRGIPALAGILCLILSSAAQADAALAQSKGCMTCHHAERKGIGPAFRDVAARYASEPTASVALARKTREGGKGAWGDGIMPPNPHVNEAESLRLANWILGMR